MREDHVGAGAIYKAARVGGWAEQREDGEGTGHTERVTGCGTASTGQRGPSGPGAGGSAGSARSDGADGEHCCGGGRGFGRGTRGGQRHHRSVRRVLRAGPSRAGAPSAAPGAAAVAVRPVSLRDKAVPGVRHQPAGPDLVRGLQRGPEAVQVQQRCFFSPLKDLPP